MNGCVALLATGGSTNHTLHLVAIARAAGLTLTWDDLSDLSAVVPLMARVYPNGKADVNHFHAAGGLAFTVHSLLKAGLLHDDVRTVAGHGLWRYTTEARLVGSELTWEEGTKRSHDTDVLRGADDPFSADGGLRMLEGNLGRAVIKTSAVKSEHQQVKAPARVFDDQADFLTAFEAGQLEGDFVAVLRFQGPAANGMPELHKLTPALGVLQDRGQRVALVTDGRMSGASGKVPAAIHLTPEASVGGPLPRVQDGDLITLDSDAGLLELHVAPYDLDGARPRVGDDSRVFGTGRELFHAFRSSVGPADQGASVFLPTDTHVENPTLSRRTPMTESLIDRVPVIPVVVLHDVAHAVPVAEALVEGGVPVIELTLRTPAALRCIEQIATQVPDILVGAGTVIDPRAGQGRGLRGRAVPGLTRYDGRTRRRDAGHRAAASARGRNCLRGAAPARARLLRDEVLPRRGLGRQQLPQGDRCPGTAGEVLPDGRHHRVQRRRRTCRCPTSAASAVPG